MGRPSRIRRAGAPRRVQGTRSTRPRFQFLLAGLLLIVAACVAAPPTTPPPSPIAAGTPSPIPTLPSIVPESTPTPVPTPTPSPTPAPTEVVPHTIDEVTLHMGTVKYDCDKDGCWMRGSGLADTPAAYYPNVNVDSPQIQAMLADIGLPATPAANDAEAWKRLWILWDWFSRHGQYSDAVNRTEAEAYLEGYTYRVKPPHFPTMADFAKVYARYGVLPWANCTAAALMFVAFAYRVGLDPNRIATAFYQTKDLSIQHVFPVIRSGDHWYYVDAVCNVPGYTQTLPYEPVNVGCIDKVDYVHPTSLGVLPGSKLTKAPLVR